MKTAKIVCLVVALLLAVQGFAAADVDVSVSAGYGGVCRIGSWNPVTITISNPDRDINGYAVVSVNKGTKTVRYMTPVSVSRTSKKQFSLYVPLGGYSPELTVDIIDGRSLVKEVKTRYRDAYSEDYIVVTVGREESALNFLSSASIIAAPTGAPAPSGRGSRGSAGSRSIQVGHLDQASIPGKPAGLDGANLLVLTDFESSRVDRSVLDTLRVWIASGGSVAVCGGADYARLKTPFFKEILPVNVESSVEVGGLDALGARYKFPIAKGSVFVTQASAKAASSVQVSHNGLPLIVQGRYGLGNVTFLAFDPLNFPLKGWDGQMNMWKDIVQSVNVPERINRPDQFNDPSGMPRSAYGAPPPAAGGLEQTALLMKSTAPPSLALIASFLIAYVLCLVPLNYFVLRKRNRFELAWLTTPAVIVVFTLLAYGAGYSLKGGQTIMNRIALLETSSNSTAASVIGYLGVYAPGRARYNLAVDDTLALASEGINESADRFAPNPANVIQAENLLLEDLDMRQWSGRTIRVESGAMLNGPVESNLTLVGQKLQGTIVNRTGTDLNSCVICFGEARQVINNFANGETKKVSIEAIVPGSTGVSSIPVPFGVSDTNLRTEVANRIGNRVTWSREPILVGWMSKSGLPAHIEGKRPAGEDIGLMLFHLSYKPGSRVVIPTGFARGVLVHNEPGAEVREENGRIVVEYVADSYYIQDFRMASGLDRAFTADALNVTTTFSGGKVEAQCYNWRTGGWDTVPNGADVPVPQPEDHVRASDGLVRVKCSVKGASSGINIQVGAQGRVR